MKKMLFCATLALAAGSAQAITVQFDYTYDSNGFFTTQHRGILNAVADEFGSRLTDSLAAINSTGGNRYQAGIGTVATDGSLSTDPMSVPEDTVIIFLGARTLDPDTLGFGGSGYSASGSSAFISLLDNRGQNASPDVDYAPVTGSIVFNANSNWYLDTDVSTVESFAGNDFYSVAVHEVAHVLGIGTSDAWDNLISGSTFTGVNASLVNGGAVPLADDGHVSSALRSSFMGTLQQPSLTPAITSGTRKYMTDLDWALLADIGWEVQPVTAVPEAQTWAMMLAGLGLLGWRLRRRAH